MIAEIEKGLLEFFKLELQGPLNYIIREKYSQNKAYWWQFPSGSVITCSKQAYHEITAHKNPKSLFSETYDSVTFLEKQKFKPKRSTSLTYRRLNKSDKKIVDDFHAFCSDEDKEHGQVSIEDSLVVGTFKDHVLVGIASTWELPNHLVDIGVIVRPDYMRQGIGVSTVSYLVSEIDDNCIPIYRADDWNRASVSIYKKLGFEEIVKIFPIREESRAT